MPHHLTSFPQGAMTAPKEDLPQVAEESRVVIREAKACRYDQEVRGFMWDLES